MNGCILCQEYHTIISGDFGGYMGLLLGCSVITLLEVLDLFLYNSLIKCRKRNQVKAYDMNEKHGSDSSRTICVQKEAWGVPPLKGQG